MKMDRKSKSQQNIYLLFEEAFSFPLPPYVHSFIGNNSFLPKHIHTASRKSHEQHMRSMEHWIPTADWLQPPVILVVH